MVLAVQDIGRGILDRRIKVARDTAHGAAAVQIIIHICQQVAEVEAVLDRAAVVRPVGDDTADIVGTAVVDRAVVDAIAQCPQVVAVVTLVADDAADMDLDARGLSASMFIRRIIIVFVGAEPCIPAHRRAVDQRSQVLAGNIGADNAADGGRLADIIAVDKPAAGSTVGDCTRHRVIAGDAAQVAAAALAVIVIHIIIAAQHDGQVVGSQARPGGGRRPPPAASGGRFVLGQVHTAIAVIISAHGIHTFKAGVSTVRLCQFGHHGIDACVGVAGVQGEPLVVDLADKCLRLLAAAVCDAAAVGACHAAHKAVPRRNDALAVCVGRHIAGADGAVVAARNAAHVGGIVQLLRVGLQRAYVVGAARLQYDGRDRAALHRAVVDTCNAADGVAVPAGRAPGKIAVSLGAGQAQRALIGTRIQGTVVLACDAAQILISFQFVALGHAESDVGALDLARVAAHCAAQGDEVCVDGQAV